MANEVEQQEDRAERQRDDQQDPAQPQRQAEPLPAAYLFMQEPAAEQRRKERLQARNERGNARRHAEMNRREYAAKISSLEQHPGYGHVPDTARAWPGCH